MVYKYRTREVGSLIHRNCWNVLHAITFSGQGH